VSFVTFQLHKLSTLKNFRLSSDFLGALIKLELVSRFTGKSFDAKRPEILETFKLLTHIGLFQDSDSFQI
jgi:hypothetical protein